MRLEEKPIFKKKIVPWYETERFFFLLIVVMFIIFLFGFVGILVSQEETEYHDYIWMPVLLVVLSGTGIVSTSVRLIKRYIQRHSK